MQDPESRKQCDSGHFSEKIQISSSALADPRKHPLISQTKLKDNKS